MEEFENLKRRLLKIYPKASVEAGVIGSNGELLFRVSIPGVQVIECSNINALAINVENLEMKARIRNRV